MPLRVCVASFLVVMGLACHAFAGDPPATATHPGRLLALTHCVTCHALPQADLLDQRTWREELLPKMRFVTGLDPLPTNGYFKDLPFLLASNYFPKAPLISRAAFDQIADYYTNAAPAALRSSHDPAKFAANTRQFTAVPAPARLVPQLTTMARIDAQQRVIMMGDATTQAVGFLTPKGELIGSLEVGNIPTSLCNRPDAYWFGCIGHFFPREEPRGQVLRYAKSSEGLRREVIAGNLPRVSHVNVADLNGDGLDDFTLCAYGNYLGRFSWWQAKPGGGFVEHVLLPEPGALRCEIRDLNGDGRLDLALLQAQARESFHIFLNDGRGGFTRQLVFQRPPSWGHSGFEFADFNGDGQPDLLVTNGDNADFNTSPPKPHHGVRIYLNRGGLKFEEAWFGPMHGAYGAAASDFDLDGDLDVAAVSFFPDYTGSPRESFLYFENTGGKTKLEFTPSGLDASLTGRWLTIDAGDLDGDGDEDLVLGSLVKVPTEVPPALKKAWETSGPSVLILRNNAKP